MSFKYVREIPSAKQILGEMPLGKELEKIKRERDAEIRRVFKREDDRFLIIIGPCSADNEDAVCEYIAKLAGLQDKVKDKLLLIPRIYTNKPRTTGEGYKGMVHQPDPTEAPNLVEGIKAIRKMHIRALRESHLASADEMLYPENYPYLEDLLSYVAIGARSVENQQHRLTVSGIDIPVGMKNPTGGDIGVMLNSVQAAQQSHVFIYRGCEVKTTGNEYAHCVLRGAVDPYGNCVANYHYEDMIHLSQLYAKRQLANPTIIIDTNHANSAKHYREQPRIAYEVLQSVKKSDALKRTVKGLMIESYLVEGSQPISEGVYGKSITDPCLGWEDTEKLLFGIADLL